MASKTHLTTGKGFAMKAVCGGSLRYPNKGTEDVSRVTCKRCQNGQTTDNSKFQRNLSGKSTYICLDCGKNTRETGLGEQGCSLCAYCFERAGAENELEDGYIDQAEYDEQVAKLNRKYNR